MKPNRFLFIQIQILAPTSIVLHHKWKEVIDIACRTNNKRKIIGTDSWQKVPLSERMTLLTKISYMRLIYGMMRYGMMSHLNSSAVLSSWI